MHALVDTPDFRPATAFHSAPTILEFSWLNADPCEARNMTDQIPASSTMPHWPRLIA